VSERAEKRKKKKSYYAKLKREEDDKMAELAAKYRDRARERRDGGAPGAPGAEGAAEGAESEAASNTSGYRAVAPDVKSSFDAAERRKRMIQARFAQNTYI
jgi:IK cytokine